MKEISYRSRSIVGCLSAILIMAIVCSLIIVLPVTAAGAPANFFSGWSWEENGQPLGPIPGQNAEGTLTLKPVVVPTPPYSTDNPGARALYLGNCPIGTKSAPLLRQSGLSSGALCRGACGIDCPPERCTRVADVTVPFEGGTCVYRNVVSCPSHQGCRDHDACYDICTEQLGDTSLLMGTCHGICNQRCYDQFGYSNCLLWAAIPGIANSRMSRMVDSSASPTFDKSLLFSDEPVFKPAPASLPPEISASVPAGTHYTAMMYALLDSASYDPDCPPSTETAYNPVADDPYCERVFTYGADAVMCGKPPAKCIDTKWNGGIHGKFSYINVEGTKADGTHYAKSRWIDGDKYFYGTDGTIVSQVTYKNGARVKAVI
jgi:hypothetical protein